MQDYGGPDGNRIIERNPEWLEWQATQNANCYEGGFTPAWDGISNALWVKRNPEKEAPLRKFLEPSDVVKHVFAVNSSL